MDIISNNPSFKRKVLFIWSALLLALHVIFTLLSVYDSYISGDIMKKSMDAFLSVILPIVALLLVYIRFGVLVSAYHSYTEATLPFTLTAIASLVLTRVSDIIIYKTAYTSLPAGTGAYLFSVLSSFMIDLAVLLLLLLFSRSKKERQRKAVVLMLIACAFPFFISMFDEISFLWVFWMEDLNGEVIFTPSMAYPFINIVITAIAGFFVMFFTHKILKTISKRGHN